jgi:FkbM family methyltransferase
MSESFQDIIAWLYHKRKDKGFYIDIGACDGLSGSNTYIFEQIGWEGLCIEPQPDVFNRLKKHRKCDCYNVAISDKGKETENFYQVEGGDALGRIAEGISDTQKKWMKETGKLKEIKVRTSTFSEIMNNYSDINHIDFMSIDVEGYEMEVLKTIDFKKWTFGLITIEASHPDRIRQLLYENNYKVFMETGADILFIPRGAVI